jgi:hypothetical protein
VGVLCLLVASLLAYPETSLHASACSLQACLLQLGSLARKVTDNRIQGRTMPRYDHRQLLFATTPTPDEQITLLSSVDKKLARGSNSKLTMYKRIYILLVVYVMLCYVVLCNTNHSFIHSFIHSYIHSFINPNHPYTILYCTVLL